MKKQLTSSIKYILFSTICLFAFSGLNAQSNTLVSVEFQAYPTGIIAGIATDFPLGAKDYFHARAGLNIFDHRDLGVQDNEEGNGYGVTLGYRRFINDEHKGWRWGIKTDLWLNTVDWEDVRDPVGLITDTTDITVLQPTAEVSYVFSNGSWIFAPSIAFGMEWNIKTEGEPTGEGAILLAGFQLARVF